jgi:hypothetical protein
MTEMLQPAITPRGTELGGAPPAGFDAVAMARRALRKAGTGALATLDPVSGFPLTTLINVATDIDGTPLFLASKLALTTTMPMRSRSMRRSCSGSPAGAGAPPASIPKGSTWSAATWRRGSSFPNGSRPRRPSRRFW